MNFKRRPIPMKVVIRKDEYPRKRTEFSVWVANAASEASGSLGIFCAHPVTDEGSAAIIASAMELLISTEEGRRAVLLNSY
jgi:hypothetical protein